MLVDAISGSVHTVHRKSTVLFLNKTRPRTASQYEICEGRE